MVEKTSRRESSKQKTRQALLEAGLAEVIEHGLDRPSLDSICARAGFTRGAFYVHFQDRRDFMDQLIDWMFRSFLETTIATDADRGIEETIRRFTSALRERRSPLQRIGMRMSQLLEATAQSPTATRMFRAFMTHAADQLAAQARRAQASGAARSDIEPESLGKLILLLAIAAMAFEEYELIPDLDRLRDALLRLIQP